MVISNRNGQPMIGFRWLIKVWQIAGMKSFVQ